MTERRSDSDISPTSLLIFTQGSNISKFCQILDFEACSFKAKQRIWSPKRSLEAAIIALSHNHTSLRSLLQLREISIGIYCPYEKLAVKLCLISQHRQRPPVADWLLKPAGHLSAGSSPLRLWTTVLLLLVHPTSKCRKALSFTVIQTPILCFYTAQRPPIKCIPQVRSWDILDPPPQHSRHPSPNFSGGQKVWFWPRVFDTTLLWAALISKWSNV